MEKQRPIKENSNLFGKIINILLIISIFFGLGYWCGKNNYTYKTIIDLLSSEKQKLKKTDKPKYEEESPETLTFHKSLKNDDNILLPSEKLKTVEKANKKEEKPVLKPFTLQLASFRKENFARDYIKKLNAVGLQPYVKKIDLKKQGVWYRVFFGEYESKEAAMEYAGQNLKPLNIYFIAVEK
ncbi:MAG: SPOR domain-containing protein [bacterium]